MAGKRDKPELASSLANKVICLNVLYGLERSHPCNSPKWVGGSASDIQLWELFK
jgi:hypothetical protein